MYGAVVATCGCKDTNRTTYTHTDTHRLLKAWDPQMTLVPFAQCAMLLCTELGCNSVLCLRAAREATKLIRLPPGG